jgi:hypothetical protein
MYKCNVLVLFWEGQGTKEQINYQKFIFQEQYSATNFQIYINQNLPKKRLNLTERVTKQKSQIRVKQVKAKRIKVKYILVALTQLYATNFNE